MKQRQTKILARVIYSQRKSQPLLPYQSNYVAFDSEFIEFAKRLNVFLSFTVLDLNLDGPHQGFRVENQ